MIYSEQPPFIFIAVPKTGSSSVGQVLQTYADTQVSSAYNKHVLAMKLQEELPAERWGGVLRFAFVRNPYSWMYSWYKFRQREQYATEEQQRYEERRNQPRGTDKNF